MQCFNSSFGITKGHKNIKLILQEFNRTKFGALGGDFSKFKSGIFIYSLFANHQQLV